MYIFTYILKKEFDGVSSEKSNSSFKRDNYREIIINMRIIILHK